MNRKITCFGIPRLNEIGKIFVKDEFKKITISIDWQYESIFSTIEGVISEINVGSILRYDVPNYYTREKKNHIIYLKRDHFEWEQEDNLEWYTPY
jgi:hypothetical protein